MPVPLVPRGGDWTDAEMAEIDRLRAVCQRSQDWELECDHTDAGDPWCIIYDRDHNQIVFHIARIDRSYVIVFPMRQWSTRTLTLSAAVDISLEELRALAPGIG
jgi:hypothetical protein